MQCGNADNVDNKRRVLKARLDNGDCTFCPPHKGENASRRTNNRYVNGKRVNRKPKEAK